MQFVTWELKTWRNTLPRKKKKCICPEAFRSPDFPQTSWEEWTQGNDLVWLVSVHYSFSRKTNFKAPSHSFPQPSTCFSRSFLDLPTVTHALPGWTAKTSAWLFDANRSAPCIGFTPTTTGPYWKRWKQFGRDQKEDRAVMIGGDMEELSGRAPSGQQPQLQTITDVDEWCDKGSSLPSGMGTAWDDNEYVWGRII